MPDAILCEDVISPKPTKCTLISTGKKPGVDPCARCRLPGGFPRMTGALCDDCEDTIADMSDFDLLVDHIEWLNGMGLPWIGDPHNTAGVIQVQSWDQVPDPVHPHPLAGRDPRDGKRHCLTCMDWVEEYLC